MSELIVLGVGCVFAAVFAVREIQFQLQEERDRLRLRDPERTD